MITAEDIAAFADDNKDAIEAAREFRRRAEKGLPTDRYGSADDMRQTARGIWALERSLDLCAYAMMQMLEAQRQAGFEAMEPTKDPMR